MADRIYKVSGYLVGKDFKGKETFLHDTINGIVGKWQQLHVIGSEPFEADEELKDNCDLALLERHFAQEESTLQFDRPIPKAGEKYRHFKIGKIITVIGISKHTETNEISVVYDCAGNGIFNRPLAMFMSEVEHDKYPNADQKYRFEKVEE